VQGPSFVVLADVVAETHVALAHHAGERRPHRRPFEPDPLQVVLCLRAARFGLGFSRSAVRRGVLLRQVLGRVPAPAGQIALRLELRDLRPAAGIVHLEERRPLLAFAPPGSTSRRCARPPRGAGRSTARLDLAGRADFVPHVSMRATTTSTGSPMGAPPRRAAASPARLCSCCKRPTAIASAAATQKPSRVLIMSDHAVPVR